MVPKPDVEMFATFKAQCILTCSNKKKLLNCFHKLYTKKLTRDTHLMQQFIYYYK